MKSYLPGPVAEDFVDKILQQWTRERPDLDVGPMGILGRLSRLTRHVERSIEETFHHFGLSIGAFDVLAALRRTGEPYRLSPSDLYNALMLSSGAMTNRIDRLEVQGLVVRVPDPADRRGVLVELTPKGRTAIDAAVTEHMNKHQGLLTDLSGDQQKVLTGLLRVLLIRFDSSNQRIQRRNRT